MGILNSIALHALSKLDDGCFTDLPVFVLRDIMRYHFGGVKVYETKAPVGRRTLHSLYQFPDGSQLQVYSNGYACTTKRIVYRPYTTSLLTPWAKAPY